MKLDPQNPDDEFMLSILTAVAKKESSDKRRRIKSKIAANALAGNAPGVNNANRAFGYALDRVTIVPADNDAMVRDARSVGSDSRERTDVGDQTPGGRLPRAAAQAV